MKKIICRLATSAVCCLLVAGSALGAEVDFLVTWSGEAHGNGASATAVITLEDTVLLNPGRNESDVNPFVVDFTMTVSGAATGNGVFGLADFDHIVLVTGPGDPGDLPLDFSRELVGQDTGTDTWGSQTGGNGGDFNVFSAAPGVPNGEAEFAVCTDVGLGDCLDLTSFRPADPGFPFSKELRKCQQAIAKAGQAYAGARHKALGKCRDSLAAGKTLYEDKAKTTAIRGAYECTAEYASARKITKAGAKARKLVEKCTDTHLSQLWACASTVDGVVGASGTAGCLLDTHDAAVDDLLDAEYGF
jgi:hypothetical protein